MEFNQESIEIVKNEYNKKLKYVYSTIHKYRDSNNYYPRLPLINIISRVDLCIRYDNEYIIIEFTPISHVELFINTATEHTHPSTLTAFISNLFYFENIDNYCINPMHYKMCNNTELLKSMVHRLEVIKIGE